MFLLIDNFDSFTFNVVQAFQQLGHDPVVLKNDDPEILKLAASGTLDKVCISPGPSNPTNAGLCLQFLELLPPTTPVFGVCLGHQTIGQAFGGKVVRCHEIVHGKMGTIHHSGQGMFRGLPSPFLATRYHSLVVDRDSLPDCLEVTAWLDDGTIMGLRHRDLPIEGVQFHPASIASEHGHQLLRNFLNRVPVAA